MPQRLRSFASKFTKKKFKNYGCYGDGSSIRMETPLPSAWRRPFHPHRLTHPFQVVPGIYGVALFAFLLWLPPLAFLSSLLTREILPFSKCDSDPTHAAKYRV